MKLRNLIKYYKNYYYSILYIIKDSPGSESRKPMVPAALIAFTMMGCYFLYNTYIKFPITKIGENFVFIIIIYLVCELIRALNDKFDEEKKLFFNDIHKYSVYIIIAKIHLTILILSVILFFVEIFRS